MGETASVPDHRALGLPDEPYSAYCRVCWQNVYGVWVERESHNGACIFGAKQIGDCAQAMSWERTKGEIKKYLAASRSLPAGGANG